MGWEWDYYALEQERVKASVINIIEELSLQDSVSPNSNKGLSAGFEGETNLFCYEEENLFRISSAKRGGRGVAALRCGGMEGVVW